MLEKQQSNFFEVQYVFKIGHAHWCKKLNLSNQRLLVVWLYILHIYESSKTLKRVNAKLTRVPYMWVSCPRTWSKFKNTPASPNQTSMWTPSQIAQLHLLWHSKRFTGVIYITDIRVSLHWPFSQDWSTAYIYIHNKQTFIHFILYSHFRSTGYCCSACNFGLQFLFLGSW